MRTDDLIKALAADQTPSGHDPSLVALAMAGFGLVVAMAALVLSLGFRPDLGAVVMDVHFALKMLVVVCLLGSALRAFQVMARPGGEDRLFPGLFILPFLVLIGSILFEGVSLPMDEWREEMMGNNALLCMMSIPLLSILPFVAMIFALRQGAPTRPVLAGALAGLVAGAIGALAYAMHCTDDSPFFVAVWYSLGLFVPVLAGILIAPRLSRW